MSYFAPTGAKDNLRVLKLQHCWELSNQGVVSLTHGLPNLTVLSLSGCSKVKLSFYSMSYNYYAIRSMMMRLK